MSSSAKVKESKGFWPGDPQPAKWPGAFFRQDHDFRFQFAAGQLEELTGITPEQWLARPPRWESLIHEADLPAFEAHLCRSLDHSGDHTITFRVRHALTGRVRHILEHRYSTIIDRGESGFKVVWLDISRQALAERRLSSACWKETLAVLTLGLAHDFNNVLAGILSLSESYLQAAPAGHPFHEGLTLIRQNSLHAAQLIHRIMNLHRSKFGQRSYCDLNEVLSDLVDLLRRTIPRSIQVQAELLPDSLALYVDETELRQVIINLALNAADAMPEGGTLRLRTFRHEELPLLPEGLGTPPQAPCATLIVEDTGCGISASCRLAIFDPFFTTKALNKGSGLGLYNARLFAERHEGFISVESEEGVGSRFGLWLPLARFDEDECAQGQAGSTRHSLLLAGEAPRILQTQAEFLRMNNYQVVLAYSPDEASELLGSVDYQFSGLLVVASSPASPYAKLLAQLRDRRAPIRRILHVAGCNQDELTPGFLRCFDLTIPHDATQESMLTRLQSLFASPA